jgi:hypothetical protein
MQQHGEEASLIIDGEEKLEKAKIRSSPEHVACRSECWGRNVQKVEQMYLCLVCKYRRQG